MLNEKQCAEKLLQINAVKLNPQEPFIWASGWRSPIYCDNRKILSFPLVRDYIKSELSNLIFTQFPEAEVIAGVATAGIPHAALVADLLKLPMIYVRAEAKKHGMGNQIEGNIKAAQKVLVIEDLISTGKSSMEAIKALQNANTEVIGICALFTYGFKEATNLFAQENIPMHTLSNYNALLEAALEMQYIKASEMEILQKWRENPAIWMQ